MLSKLILIALLTIYCVSIQADLITVLLVFGFSFILLPTLDYWFIPTQEVQEVSESDDTDWIDSIESEPTGRAKSMLNLKQYQQ
jgi:hypothetical protein